MEETINNAQLLSSNVVLLEESERFKGLKYSRKKDEALSFSLLIDWCKWQIDLGERYLCDFVMH